MQNKYSTFKQVDEMNMAPADLKKKDRFQKVSRTIPDLEESRNIEPHLPDGKQYRQGMIMQAGAKTSSDY